MPLDALLAACFFTVTAGMCLLAVISPAYDDTLFQRILLACICLDSLGVAIWLVQAGQCPEPLYWLAAWQALFALETARKYFAQAAKPPAQPPSQSPEPTP